MEKVNAKLAKLLRQYEENPDIATRLDIAILLNESWDIIYDDLKFEAMKIVIKR